MSDSRDYLRIKGRVRMKIGDFEFRLFASLKVARDLQDIAGVFEAEITDLVRLRQALKVWIAQGFDMQQQIDAGLAVTISVDGDPILIGWIEVLDLEWNAERIECHVRGRDRTGDLVECAALPDGPAEFRNVDLLHVAKHVCAPFGIPVRADVDLGAPFDRLSAYPHENAMPFLEKAARQRSVLLTSDGVGGLLLTRGGKTRGPAPLVMGENIHDLGFKRDFTHRYSRYIVKGQTAKHGGGTAALDHSVEPEDGADDPAPVPGAASANQAAAIVMTGEARDPEMTRYRPIVRQVRTQSGMSTVQEQAEWMLRVARGQSENLHAQVLDWRDGPERKLWLPNQVVAVSDPLSGLDKDMLIAGVEYELGEMSMKTSLRLAGVTAFDRINEPQRRRHRHRDHAAAHLDSTVEPLTVR